MSIQMMTAARSHISTTTTTEVPTVRQCHQVRQVKVNNGARMFIKVPTYRRRWPRGIESPPTYSSDQRWLSTSSRVPFHRRLNGFQWPYVSFREIKPLTYRIGVTWVKLPPEIPLRSEVKDPDIPLTIITTESGIQRQNTLVLQDTKENLACVLLVNFWWYLLSDKLKWFFILKLLVISFDLIFRARITLVYLIWSKVWVLIVILVLSLYHIL